MTQRQTPPLNLVRSVSAGDSVPVLAGGGPPSSVTESSLGDTLPSRPHPPTRSDSFEALFVPADMVVAPLPFSFHLLELVRPLVVPDPAHPYREYTIQYPNGHAVRVELHGHNRLGPPTVNDMDVVFAVMDRAREVGLTDRFELLGVPLLDLARRMGESEKHYGGSRSAALKKRLDRLSGFRFRTNFLFPNTRRTGDGRDGRVRPFSLDSAPSRVRPKLEWYHIFQYGLAEAVSETDDMASPAGDGSRELIRAIRFDPVWFDDMANGYTAWIDHRLHAALPDRYSKRLYEVLFIRALRVPTWSHIEPWVLPLNALLDEMGIAVTGKHGKRLRTLVVSKLPGLVQRGVLARTREVPGRDDKHLIELVPGERLIAARGQVGVRLGERPESARLMWALQQPPWAFSTTEARYWVDARPGTVLRVLQHAVYLYERGWEPRKSWGGWVKEAIKEDFRFESDARYIAWLDARLRGYRIPAWVDVRLPPVRLSLRHHNHEPPRALVATAATEVGPRNTPTGIAPAPTNDPATAAAVAAALLPDEVFEDTIWGQVRKQLRATMQAEDQEWNYVAWLSPLQLVRAPTHDDPRLVLAAPDQFAAEWVANRFYAPIAAVASEILGVPVTLEIQAGREPLTVREQGAG